MDINIEYSALSVMIFTLAYLHKKITGSSTKNRVKNMEIVQNSMRLNISKDITNLRLKMNTVSYLKQISGNEKTLIISCIESCMEVESLNNEQFYRHTTLGNVINHDTFQEESIRYYIESKKCTRIVVVGHTDCKAIKSILDDSLDSESIIALKSELQGLLINNHSHFLKTELHELLVVELSIIKLCRSLLQYSFIYERLQKEKMNLTGIVFNHTGITRKIFYNGIVFNSLISNN